MKRAGAIILKSAVAACLSVVATLAVVVTVVPAIGGVVDGNAWLMCVICPLVVAAPASAWQFWQNDRQRMARAELAAVHVKLDEAHRALAAAYDELAERAKRDDLTGLLGRGGFLEVAAERRKSGEGWLMILDVDHFKTINDRFGHAIGDRALRQVAATFIAAGPADAVFGRIGGEEFGAVLSAMDRDDAVRIADALRREIAEAPLRLDEPEAVSLTVSAGVVRLTTGDTLSDAVLAADELLYEAKRNGRNAVAFEEAASSADELRQPTLVAASSLAAARSSLRPSGLCDGATLLQGTGASTA
ncbi:MAG TPA: GGDEF domain-containing protein [Hansschlegelia sp.]